LTNKAYLLDTVAAIALLKDEPDIVKIMEKTGTFSFQLSLSASFTSVLKNLLVSKKIVEKSMLSRNDMRFAIWITPPQNYMVKSLACCAREAARFRRMMSGSRRWPCSIT